MYAGFIFFQAGNAMIIGTKNNFLAEKNEYLGKLIYFLPEILL